MNKIKIMDFMDEIDDKFTLSLKELQANMEAARLAGIKDYEHITTQTLPKYPNIIAKFHSSTGSAYFSVSAPMHPHTHTYPTKDQWARLHLVDPEASHVDHNKETLYEFRMNDIANCAENMISTENSNYELISFDTEEEMQKMLNVLNL